MRSLRILTQVRLTDPLQNSGNTRIRHAAFTNGLFAVLLQFAVSGNTRGVPGIDYTSVGGNPLLSFWAAAHPTVTWQD